VGRKTDVQQGTLALMILKTLDTLGPLHGYGVARRIEQTSGDLLSVNYGTIYPALLKLEQEGAVESSWGVSDKLARETRDWEQTTSILSRFLSSERG
jgi:PadR family transcriptional regulator PadR